jgi:hypothetical protein
MRLPGWRLACVVEGCDATKPMIPSSDQLDFIKEKNVLAVAQHVLKGLAAAASAAIASYGVAVTDGTVTAEEWITLGVAALGAGLVV